MNITTWLRSPSLEQYETTFRDNAIDLDVLPQLSELDLEKMGILLGHRKMLLKAIAGLNKQLGAAGAGSQTEFLESISALTGSEAGRGGLASLIDSAWLLSLSIFHQPEIIGQPSGTCVWWGYGLYPERNGDFVRKRTDTCTGEEILEEVLRQLRFDRQLDAITASSICIPCDMDDVHTHRQAPPGSGGVHQPRTCRSVRGGFAGCGVHD